MPPTPGVFPVPYASTNTVRVGPSPADFADFGGTYHSHHHNAIAGPSTRNQGPLMEDPKGKRRKEMVSRLGREMGDRREEFSYSAGRHYAETIAELNTISFHLSTRPDSVPAYQLRLYPLSLERSALLASLVMQERYALDCIQTAHEEERERVEDEWKKGREKIKERLLEGIEERRRRAREEKEGEGAAGDASLDSQSRTHVTRKLRNKLGGTSPPPTPLASVTPGFNGITPMASGPITTGPFLNPHSLSVDELPSPFPLPLVSAHLSSGSGYGGATGPSNSRKRNRGGKEAQAIGGLGKSLFLLSSCKEAEVEADLIEIRRGSKRRRAAAATNLQGKS